MIQRREPLKRVTPLKRSTKPIARYTLPKKKSATMIEREKEWSAIVSLYFKVFGPKGEAPCQSCVRDMTRKDAQPHHKLRRGAGGSDEPENFVVLCKECHIDFIHDKMMGASTEKARQRQAIVIASEADATNGKTIVWPPEMEFELTKTLLGGKTEIF